MSTVHGSTPMCTAMSKPLVKDDPSTYFICTQDPGHSGPHAACDGNGRVFATWRRRAVERYWQPPKPVTP